MTVDLEGQTRDIGETRFIRILGRILELWNFYGGGTVTNSADITISLYKRKVNDQNGTSLECKLAES